MKHLATVTITPHQVTRTVMIAGLILACWSTTSCKRDNLTERPPRSAEAPSLPKYPSNLGVAVTLPYDTIQAALNATAPQQYDGSGKQKVCIDVYDQVTKKIPINGTVGGWLKKIVNVAWRVVTVNQLRHVCQDVAYHFSIKRTGPVTVSPLKNAVRVVVPISADGVAGFTGDIAKAVALNKKNFRGSIIATADVSLDVGSDWCPTARVATSFVWKDKAQLEVAHKFWINIDSSATEQINKLSARLSDQVAKALDCSKVRNAVAPLFVTRSVPIKTVKNDVIYINVEPTSAGFSGLRYDADAVRIAMSLGGTSEVSTTPAAQTKASLPQLTRIPTAADEISIALPLRLGYDELIAQLNDALRGHVFEGRTKAGKVSVKLNTLDVYPAGKELVFGLAFSARLPGRLFDTSGQVYLIGTPQIDAANQVLWVKGVSFTRDVDNKIWAATSYVFQDQIRSALEKAATLDLKPSIISANAKLQQELADLSTKPPHINVVLRTDQLGLSRIVLTDRDLELLTIFKATADVTVPLAAVPQSHVKKS